MSNNYIKTLVTQMKDVLGRKVGAIDSTKYIVSPSVPREIDANVNDIWDACMRPDTVYRFAGYTFVAFGKGKCEYITFALGDDEEAERCSRILGTAISGIKAVYDDKFDKGNFIKNVLLDNVLPGDIFAKARELNLMNETKRTVFDISKKDLSVNEFNAREIVERIFPDTARDFVITIDRENIVLVKEIPEDEEYNPEETAKSIVNTLESEAMISVTVGIGTPVCGIRELAKSYKEAQIAIEIGQVFDEDKHIINYSNLGIARLIYQLPTTLCELFLSEVFREGSIEALDRETLITIDKFFENNLNVSETSRQLYVHRNTLVYRLDKVQKLTGLDLRVLDHAIVFKVALLVKKYLNATNERLRGHYADTRK